MKNSNTVYIDREELQQQINLRNYYMGNSVKRNDIDADTIQSSEDDNELFVMFQQRALNELITAVALRFPSIAYKIDDNYIEVTFESYDDTMQHLLPMLKQSLIDYLVNESLLQWLLLRSPAMAQAYISLRHVLYDNVYQQFAKFYNRRKVRRRATNLAGI